MVNWKRPTRADIIAAVTPIAEQRGLVVRYVDADDPDVEDDSVDFIGRDGAEHDVSIQVCLSGGFSYTVFENGEDGGSYWQGEAVDNPADAAKAGFAKYDELGGAEAVRPKHPLLTSNYPEFDQSELPDLPEGFADSTYHTDAARFLGPGVSVDISPIDRSKREMGEDWPRYNVLRSPTAEDVAEYGDPATAEDGGAEDQPLIGTESWHQALYAMRPYFNNGEGYIADPKPDFEALAIEAYKAEVVDAGGDQKKKDAASEALRLRLGELRWDDLAAEGRFK